MGGDGKASGGAVVTGSRGHSSIIVGAREPLQCWERHTPQNKLELQEEPGWKFCNFKKYVLPTMGLNQGKL